MKHLPSLVAVLAAPFVATSRAAVIYGGPTYNSSTTTGYQSPGLPIVPGGTAGDGSAVGFASKYASGASVGTRAVRWDASGASAVELGNLGTASGTTFSQAFAVNTVGTVVGYAYKYTAGTNLGQRAVRWNATGTTATELDNLGTAVNGSTSSQASAVNASGTAVGYAEKYASGTDLGQRAVRWDNSGTVATELGNLGTAGSGSTYSQSFAVNTAGTAVGYAQKYTGGTNLGVRAVRWDATATAATELDNLGTASNGSANSYAYSVNINDVAVGFAEKYVAGTNNGFRAVRWDAGGTAATELGNLGTSSNGTAYNVAYAINAGGTAVGYAQKYSAGINLGYRAARWDVGDPTATELGNLGTNNSGVANDYAYAVNSDGNAVGYAEKYTAGTLVGRRAVLWGFDATAVDLNTLLSPTDAALWILTEAHGISDTGWVTGLGTYDPDGTGPLTAYSRAFLIQIPEPTSMILVTLFVTGTMRRWRMTAGRCQ